MKNAKEITESSWNWWPGVIAFFFAIGYAAYSVAVNEGRIKPVADFSDEDRFGQSFDATVSDIVVVKAGSVDEAGGADPLPNDCRQINTDDWGFGEHYDPSLPEISTASQAIAELRAMGYLGDQVILTQGSEMKIVNVNDPILAELANGSTFCPVAK